MCSPARSASRRAQAGFTLIELMIGVVIGLLASLAVTHVLVNAEGAKRTTTSASDAQINGALALSTLQRSVQSSGYGFTSIPAVVGCTLTATFGGAPVDGFPTRLAPVMITPNATAGLPDTIRVLASGKTTFAMPLRVVAPGYKKNDVMFPVASTIGVAGPVTTGTKVPGDLMVAASSATSPCTVFQVTAAPTAALEVARADDAGWNTAGSPAESYGSGSFLINLGKPFDVAYSIVDNSLRATTLNLNNETAEPSYDAAPVELFPNIVQLQAYYGKDSANTGVVDTWDKVAPTTNEGWLKVIAVRVAVVARSTQFEKEDVTHDNLQWDVGTAIAIAGTADCGTSKCVTLKIDHLDDWKRYRYRVFDTVIPLRNMLWNS